MKAVADYPAAIFAEDLIAAYPEAKIILTVRDEGKWYASMMSTLVHAHTHRFNPDSPVSYPFCFDHTTESLSRIAPALRLVLQMAPLSTRYHSLCWDNDFVTNGRKAYRAQNELVRRLSQHRDFLEYEVSS